MFIAWIYLFWCYLSELALARKSEKVKIDFSWFCLWRSPENREKVLFPARIDFFRFYLRRLPENREKSIYRGLEPKQTIIPSFFVLFDHHCLLMWSLTLWLDTCSWIWLFLSHSLLLLLLSFSYDLPFHLFWWFTLFFTSLLIPLMLFIWLITFDGDRRSTLFVLDSHL